MFWKKKKNADKDNGKPVDPAVEQPPAEAPTTEPATPPPPAPAGDTPEGKAPDTPDAPPADADEETVTEPARRGWRRRLSG
ncbi:MAG TPA: signal recognition particle-docking protein FtsY, partial [Oleiagrimonas sp.]|nr:signal recognition particle-docking protein FtsY [Oleiagrimonas sp.]